eukprot:s784_g14.t1
MLRCDAGAMMPNEFKTKMALPNGAAGSGSGGSAPGEEAAEPKKKPKAKAKPTPKPNPAKEFYHVEIPVKDVLHYQHPICAALLIVKTGEFPELRIKAYAGRVLLAYLQSVVADRVNSLEADAVPEDLLLVHGVLSEMCADESAHESAVVSALPAGGVQQILKGTWQPCITSSSAAAAAGRLTNAMQKFMSSNTRQGDKWRLLHDVEDILRTLGSALPGNLRSTAWAWHARQSGRLHRSQALQAAEEEAKSIAEDFREDLSSRLQSGVRLLEVAALATGAESLHSGASPLSPSVAASLQKASKLQISLDQLKTRMEELGSSRKNLITAGHLLDGYESLMRLSEELHAAREEAGGAEYSDADRQLMDQLAQEMKQLQQALEEKLEGSGLPPGAWQKVTFDPDSDGSQGRSSDRFTGQKKGNKRQARSHAWLKGLKEATARAARFGHALKGSQGKDQLSEMEKTLMEELESCEAAAAKAGDSEEQSASWKQLRNVWTQLQDQLDQVRKKKLPGGDGAEGGRLSSWAMSRSKLMPKRSHTQPLQMKDLSPALSVSAAQLQALQEEVEPDDCFAAVSPRQPKVNAAHGSCFLEHGLEALLISKALSHAADSGNPFANIFGNSLEGLPSPGWIFFSMAAALPALSRGHSEAMRCTSGEARRTVRCLFSLLGFLVFEICRVSAKAMSDFFSSTSHPLSGSVLIEANRTTWATVQRTHKMHDAKTWEAGMSAAPHLPGFGNKAHLQKKGKQGSTFKRDTASSAQRTATANLYLRGALEALKVNEWTSNQVSSSCITLTPHPLRDQYGMSLQYSKGDISSSTAALSLLGWSSRASGNLRANSMRFSTISLLRRGFTGRSKPGLRVVLPRRFLTFSCFTCSFFTLGVAAFLGAAAGFLARVFAAAFGAVPIACDFAAGETFGDLLGTAGSPSTSGETSFLLVLAFFVLLATWLEPAERICRLRDFMGDGVGDFLADCLCSLSWISWISWISCFFFHSSLFAGPAYLCLWYPPSFGVAHPWSRIPLRQEPERGAGDKYRRSLLQRGRQRTFRRMCRFRTWETVQFRRLALSFSSFFRLISLQRSWPVAEEQAVNRASIFEIEWAAMRKRHGQRCRSCDGVFLENPRFLPSRMFRKKLRGGGDAGEDGHRLLMAGRQYLQRQDVEKLLSAARAGASHSAALVDDDALAAGQDVSGQWQQLTSELEDLEAELTLDPMQRPGTSGRLSLGIGARLSPKRGPKQASTSKNSSGSLPLDLLEASSAFLRHSEELARIRSQQSEDDGSNPMLTLGQSIYTQQALESMELEVAKALQDAEARALLLLPAPRDSEGVKRHLWAAPMAKQKQLLLPEMGRADEGPQLPTLLTPRKRQQLLEKEAAAKPVEGDRSKTKLQESSFPNQLLGMVYVRAASRLPSRTSDPPTGLEILLPSCGANSRCPRSRKPASSSCKNKQGELALGVVQHIHLSFSWSTEPPELRSRKKPGDLPGPKWLKWPEPRRDFPPDEPRTPEVHVVMVFFVKHSADVSQDTLKTFLNHLLHLQT